VPDWIHSWIYPVFVDFEITFVLSGVKTGGVSELSESVIRISEDCFGKTKSVKRGQDFFGDTE
jgi:hypothetical protein